MTWEQWCELNEQAQGVAITKFDLAPYVMIVATINGQAQMGCYVCLN